MNIRPSLGAASIVIDERQTREMRTVAYLFGFIGINKPPTVVRNKIAGRRVG